MLHQKDSLDRSLYLIPHFFDKKFTHSFTTFDNFLNSSLFKISWSERYWLCQPPWLEKIFPELIHNSSDYIANIYTYAKYENGVITLERDISNLINIDDELKIVLDNNDVKKFEIAIDDTPYNNRYKRRFVKVLEIIDNHSFKINIELNESNIFIYGKKVDNF